MKKLIMVLGALFLLVMSTYAQEVPAPVVKAFEGKYSAAEDLDWEQGDEGKWEAEFYMAEKEFSALFTIEGEWIKTEQTLTADEIPASLIAMLESEMNGYEIDDVELVETPKGKFYRLEVEVDEKVFILKVDMDGKVLEKKMSSERSDGL